MGLGDRFHNQKHKLNNDTNDDTLRPMKKPGKPEDHKFMTSHFHVIKKLDQSIRKQGNIYYDKQTQWIKNPHNNKSENRNL